MQNILPVKLLEVVHDGILLLKYDQTILFANRAFYKIFSTTPIDTIGRQLRDLTDVGLSTKHFEDVIRLLISHKTPIYDMEIDQIFPAAGRRVLILNACLIDRNDGDDGKILLAIQDITKWRCEEEQQVALRDRSGLLLRELTHRVKNSLQLIAAIVAIEAGSQKLEGREELENVSRRIAAIGRLYATLDAGGTVETLNARAYLNDLCRDLAASVHGTDKSIELRADIEDILLPQSRAIPIGLIVNELVINAVKYAFPTAAHGTVTVSLRRMNGEILLTVEDDGKGMDLNSAGSSTGVRLLEGFAQQLGGRLTWRNHANGTTVNMVAPWNETS